MDAGTIHNLTIDLNNLGIHFEYQGPEEVTLGNGSKLPISHIGKSFIIVSNKKFDLDDILHVPTATQNLLSISSFAKSKKVLVEFFPGYFLIKDLATRDIRHKGPTEGGLYSLPVQKPASPASYVASLGVWHARFDHASYPTLRHILSSSALSCSSNKNSSLCTVSTSHKISFSESRFQASGPLI